MVTIENLTLVGRTICIHLSSCGSGFEDMTFMLFVALQELHN